MTLPDDAIGDEDPLAVGDVVVDDVSHRVMQVTGRSLKPANEVDEVWKKVVNHHRYDISPDDSLVELVVLPNGERYFIPREPQIYPEKRLSRIPTKPATGDRRPQSKVARAVLAQIVSDARCRDHDGLGEAIVTLVAANYGSEFANEVREFADLRDDERGGSDG